MFQRLKNLWAWSKNNPDDFIYKGVSVGSATVKTFKKQKKRLATIVDLTNPLDDFDEIHSDK